MALKRRSKVDSGFSMSSMTDIVFLLLIFFMITSTLVTPFAVNLDLPVSSHQTSAKPNTTISITPDLRYYVEGDEVAFEMIESRLAEILSNAPEMYVALHVDQSVPFSEVGKIRDIAIRNKYKLILATRGR